MTFRILMMALAFALFTGCSSTTAPTHSSSTHAPTHAENISCIFDSKKTVTTEMFGLTEQEVGKKILGQAMLIDSKSDRNHIHVVFAEGGECPKFIEHGIYDLRGEFKIHNPTQDGKPKKFPIANYRYFLVSSWKLADAK